MLTCAHARILVTHTNDIGLGYNVFNNIWNTNYVLWYPFADEDKNLKARFSLRLQDQV